MFERRGIRQPFSLGPYNKVKGDEQWIRLSQGCRHQCPFCYEPKEEKMFPIPEIVKNKVGIMDMNLTDKPGALELIKRLGEIRVDGKVVHYELICGIDWRTLTQEMANALKASRVQRPRIAWDFGYEDQFKIKDAINMLIKAGYKCKDIMVFMICNWEIPFAVCVKKLFQCGIWGVKVGDCYFDGQTSPNVEPIGWTEAQIKTFRRFVRKQNQLMLFGIDPELNKRRSDG